MGTGARLAGFTLGLAVLFGVAYTVGAAVGNPLDDPASSGTGHHHGSGAPDGGGHQHGGAAGGGHQHGGAAGGGHQHGGAPGGMDHPVGGLAIAENGYRLSRVSADPIVGQPAELAFQVIGPVGQPVTSFVTTHDKPLHLIVARRDLSGFQHLHPAMDPGGTWRVPLVLGAAGDYRLFADFVPDNRLDTVVLGMDLAVPGDYRPTPLPPPVADPEVSTGADGYRVRMTRDGDLARFSITRDGAPVTDLQPYLGAYGHLVALRQGDLGYLHVHPEGGPGLSPPGPDVTFGAALPPGGTYRLYLQFAHRDGVRTAEFTVRTTDAPG